MIKLEEEEINFIILGAYYTGKTSLINRAIGMNFNENERSTDVNSFVTKQIIKGNKKYNLILCIPMERRN